MDEQFKITKEITAKEKSERLVGHLIINVRADDQKEGGWSEDTLAWWNEIDSRMSAPACLNFDWESAKKEIEEAVENENYRIARNRDYMTSWCVGIKDGLWKAYNIMNKYVKVKE